MIEYCREERNVWFKIMRSRAGIWEWLIFLSVIKSQGVRYLSTETENLNMIFNRFLSALPERVVFLKSFFNVGIIRRPNISTGIRMWFYVELIDM